MASAFKHTLASIILVLSFVAPVAAAPPDDHPETKAVDAFTKGDYANALKLFRIAADQGNPVGQFWLGFMYETGQGVSKNAVEAVKWYRLAAAQGFTGAQVNLGDMYFHGRGVIKNYPEALKWRQMAANDGDRGAQAQLALMYVYGKGAPQDYVQAYMWFSLAAAQGYKAAAEGKDITERHLTPAQISQAQKLAREWKPAQHPQ